MGAGDLGRRGLAASALFAGALLLLPADAAASQCSRSERVDHRNAECLDAWWKNRGLLKKSPWHVSNQCSDYGKVVAKVDLASARDRTLHLSDGLPRDGDTRNRIRGIACCSDMGICNRSDVVTDEGCLAQYNRVSSATYTCHNEFAVAAISGDTYNCTISAHCWITTPPPERYPYMPTRITVPWFDLDEVHNCGGYLRRGPCSRARSVAHTLSVHDARVGEAGVATLDFRVRLNPPFPETVTVRYATKDGTARAGSDYRETAGMMSFRPGETEKTISVPVLDDEVDEDPETLTLTLSNSSPSRVHLDDATATGTIVNTDRMPQAWIGRFGRTVADQVLDAVDTRMRARPVPGVEARLAGQRIGLGPPFAAGPGQGVASGEDQVAEFAQPVSEGNPLPGSSFSLTAETDGDGFVSIWGEGAATRFSGQKSASAQAGGGLTVEGDVTTGLLGADWTRGPWTTGLLVTHSRGDGGYRGVGGGTITSTLTGVWPWVSHALGERLSVWGIAGYGEGILKLATADADGARTRTIGTDLDLMMAAAGLRGVAVDGGRNGLTLAVKTDAMIVRTASDAASGAGGTMAAAEAEVTRLRLGLEGSRPFPLADGSVLTPSMEIGLRRDGGDAETGFGAEFGAGIAWRDPGRGLGAALRARGLLAHEAKGFRERGLSVSFSWDPVAGDRGPRLSLTQSVGGSSSGSADALFGRTTQAGLAANDNRDELQQRRLEARFGYGFAALGDRFTATPEVAVGLTGTGRDYSLGWRLVRRARPGDTESLELSFEARRRESANPGSGSGAGSGPAHEAGFRITRRY